MQNNSGHISFRLFFILYIVFFYAAIQAMEEHQLESMPLLNDNTNALYDKLRNAIVHNHINTIRNAVKIYETNDLSDTQIENLVQLADRHELYTKTRSTLLKKPNHEKWYFVSGVACSLVGITQIIIGLVVTFSTIDENKSMEERVHQGVNILSGAGVSSLGVYFIKKSGNATPQEKADHAFTIKSLISQLNNDAL